MITCDSSVQHPFQPGAHGLACDGVSLQSIVASVGTPAYIYSARAIRDAYRAIDDAFGSYPHAIHYALKANSTLAIVRVLKALGSHADANSGGEIEVALRAGFGPREIVFTGVGKTGGELEYAIESDVGGGWPLGFGVEDATQRAWLARWASASRRSASSDCADRHSAY